MADIVTLDEMRTHPDFLGVTFTAEQIGALEQIRKAVESAVVAVLGYNPAQATYTEFYPKKRAVSTFDGDNLFQPLVTPDRTIILERGNVWRQVLALNAIPVRSITTVYENMSAWSGGTATGDWPVASLVPATAYRLQQEEPGLCKTGFVIRAGAWTDAPACIKITYVAGYTAAELTERFNHVKEAVKIAVVYNWVNSKLRNTLAAGTDGRLQNSFAVTDYRVDYVDLSALGLAAFGGAGGSGILPQTSLAMLGREVNLTEYF